MQLELEMANLTEQERNGMQSDIQQMDAIIGQFLDYAKPADSAGFIPINLTPMLAEAAQEAGRLPAMHVSVDLDEDVSVNGNATELQRVINNLLENARRYGRSEGSGIADVEISCHRSGSEILVEIADHGPGVPEDDRERLLHPFTQLDTARGQANGAGLGLAIVNRVIKRHGGRLRLKNRESGGLIVSIVLPLASA
jgi:two-component system osmolarity sensor histidine kinase EnvZ